MTNAEIESVANAMLKVADEKLPGGTAIVFIADAAGTVYTAGAFGHPLAVAGLLSLKTATVFLQAQKACGP